MPSNKLDVNLTKPSDQLDDIFTIQGRLGSDSFVPWIERHAHKLGLKARFLSVSDNAIDLSVQGAPDLVDALEMGCLLGPIDVWVQDLTRASSNSQNAFFFNS